MESEAALFFFFFFNNLFICFGYAGSLLLLYSSCSEQGHSLVAVPGLLTAEASLVAEPRVLGRRASGVAAPGL